MKAIGGKPTRQVELTPIQTPVPNRAASPPDETQQALDFAFCNVPDQRDTGLPFCALPGSPICDHERGSPLDTEPIDDGKEHEQMIMDVYLSKTPQ